MQNYCFHPAECNGSGLNYQTSESLTSANLASRAGGKVISYWWFTCITKRQPSAEGMEGGIRKGEKKHSSK